MTGPPRAGFPGGLPLVSGVGSANSDPRPANARRDWHDATPDAIAAAYAFREVLGDRRRRERGEPPAKRKRFT